MNDRDRPRANNAAVQIINNMTAEMQNIDAQYVPLSYTSPSNSNWKQLQNTYLDSYPVNSEAQSFSSIPPFNIQHQHSYISPEPHFIDSYGKFNYEMYPKNQELSANVMPAKEQETSAMPLIDSLVGNWKPSAAGTYSIFGSVDVFKPNISGIEQTSNKENAVYSTCQISSDQHANKFQFNRDNNKPRMVAEVKPMRPTYSDVLTKPVVPNTTPVKVSKDVKENKPKKDNVKKSKNEKSQKGNACLSRANTNNDINVKEINAEKSTNNVKASSDRTNKKNDKLNRKWSSMDSINEPLINKQDKNKKKDSSDDNSQQRKDKKSFEKVRNNSEMMDDFEAVGGDSVVMHKNGVKKGKNINKSKSNEASNGGDKYSGKRGQRTRKREGSPRLEILWQKFEKYLKEWWKLSVLFLVWLLQLISDVCSLSIHVSRDMTVTVWNWLKIRCLHSLSIASIILQRIRFVTWLWEKIKKKEKVEERKKVFHHPGLQHNLTMPTTGEEAMKRLLACKGKDPYSILGVTPTCTDEDIKRYYKRQAVLVHPDKNQQPGAEEAFKILVHAFDMIGVPEKREAYDRGVAESAQVEQAWNELNDLLAQLQKKVEAAANTIRCSSCGQRHKRTKMPRPMYAARNCLTCKIHHSAREGDIWAEAQCFGLLWHYYACMDGGVYEITEWAACQKDSLKHLKPDSHLVQYRIALGKQSNNPPKKQSSSKGDKPPNLEELFNSLYTQSDGGQSAKKRNKKSNK